MGLLITRAVREMGEAVAASGKGAKVDFVPEGCHFRKDSKEDQCWLLFLPIYAIGVPICISFYLDEKDNLIFVMATEGGRSHELTDDETSILEDVYTSLYTAGAFNG